MIVWYFFRQCLSYGLLFFTVLTAIFTSCNLFIRLPVLNNVFAIPQVLFMMLPVMALFALPLAASLAVFVVVIQHKMHDELLVMTFLRRARRALYVAVGLFAGLCGLAYIALVFQFAPNSYRVGKQIILNVAKEHLLQLEPNKFHTPFPGLTFFFKKKEQGSEQVPFYTTLFLVYSPKKDERYFFTAQKGFFVKDQLFLYNGSMYTIKQGHFHAATFQRMNIDFRTLIAQEAHDQQLSHIKYSTWRRLLVLHNTEQEAFIELHKRSAQVLWQFILPLLALLLALIARRNSLLVSIGTCGSLFLASYIFVVLGQVFAQYSAIALLFFYLPIVLMVIGTAWVYKRHYC